MSDVRIAAAGDAALVAEFGDRIDVALNARATALAEALARTPVHGIRDIVPTFRSVAVYFDPLVTDVEQLRQRLLDLAAAPEPTRAETPRPPVVVPVCYGGEFGPDLGDVASFAGLSEAETVERHATASYRVFMLGFMPGFAYLGVVDPRIAAPRRQAPRARVPAGSVGIAGAQTGVYPRETPGGWQIVGRTPLTIFAFDREPPCVFRAGDTVQFQPITAADFARTVDREGAR